MTSPGKFDWRGLLDWHTARPALGRLLAMDRELDNRQRTVALDLVTMVTPRTARFYAAVAILTLGPDIKIAEAVRELPPAVGALLEVIAADEKKYARTRTRAEKALGTFRTIADQRPRRKI